MISLLFDTEDVIMGSIIGIVCAYIVMYMYREERYIQEHNKQRNILLL